MWLLEKEQAYNRKIQNVQFEEKEGPGSRLVISPVVKEINILRLKVSSDFRVRFHPARFPTCEK